jgi:uncharacterized OB-fold protein
VFPRRVVCPVCGSAALADARSDGRGVVYSATTVHARGEPPYDVALVDLDEGFRMMSTVAGIGPGEVRIGMAVRARTDDEGRVVFGAA